MGKWFWLFKWQFSSQSSLNQGHVANRLIHSIRQFSIQLVLRNAIAKPRKRAVNSNKTKVNYGALSRHSQTMKTKSPRRLDEELEESYTAQAFKKFIVNKGLREPESYVCSLAEQNMKIPED